MILNFFLFYSVPKKWVGRAMGDDTFYGDGLNNELTRGLEFGLLKEFPILFV